MKNKTFKNILSVCALSLVGMIPLTKANAQEYRPMRMINNHCKFIKNNTEIVVNYRDTLRVYNIDTIYDNNKKQIACDLGPGNDILVFDPDWYRTHPWIPPIERDDTIAWNLVKKHDKAVKAYYEHEKAGDYEQRDEAEKAILAFRNVLADWTKRRIK